MRTALFSLILIALGSPALAGECVVNAEKFSQLRPKHSGINEAQDLFECEGTLVSRWGRYGPGTNNEIYKFVDRKNRAAVIVEIHNNRVVDMMQVGID